MPRIPGTSEDKLLGSESWNWLGGGAEVADAAAGEFSGVLVTVPVPAAAGVETVVAAGSGVITVLVPGADAAGCGWISAPLALGVVAVDAAGCGWISALLALLGVVAVDAAGVVEPPPRTDAALCSNWETPAGEAICCTTSSPGTAGAGFVGAAGSAAATGLSATTAGNMPAAATAAVAKRFFVRDMVSPNLFDLVVVGTKVALLLLGLE